METMVYIFYSESHLAGRMLNGFNLFFTWAEKLYFIHRTCHNIHTALGKSVRASSALCPCRNRAGEVVTSSGKGNKQFHYFQGIDQQPWRGRNGFLHPCHSGAPRYFLTRHSLWSAGWNSYFPWKCFPVCLFSSLIINLSLTWTFQSYHELLEILLNNNSREWTLFQDCVSTFLSVTFLIRDGSVSTFVATTRLIFRGNTSGQLQDVFVGTKTGIFFFFPQP